MKKGSRKLKDVLPEYDPPENIWESLAGDLDKPALQQLPEYSPDESVWNLIEHELKKQTRWTRVTAWSRVAAAVLLVAAGSVWIVGEETINVSFSEEIYDERLQVTGSSDVDNQYDLLIEYCSNQSGLCSRSDFKQLREEFEELRRAAEELRSALGDYNVEKLLIEEHIGIENRKVTVLNELAKLI